MALNMKINIILFDSFNILFQSIKLSGFFLLAAKTSYPKKNIITMCLKIVSQEKNVRMEVNNFFKIKLYFSIEISM